MQEPLQQMLLPHRWLGEGEPLVLIAGLGGKGASWQPFLDAAAQRFRVLSFDNPGAGQSPPLVGPVSIRELAQRVCQLFDGLGIEKAHVVGRSMGGMIAQELALLAPERIERLVLVSTTARPDTHLQTIFGLWARMAELELPADLRRQSSLLWCLGSHSLTTNPQVQAYLRATRSAGRPRDYALQAQACARHDALERLSKLRTRALIVSGTDDRLTPPRHAEELAKAIPGAELAYIPEAGHLAYLESPELFARVVLGYLKNEAGA